MTDIKKLLDKYWEGETSLEEERMIKDYFASGNTTNDRTGDLFALFEKEKKIEYSGNWNLPVSNVVKFSFKRELAIAASIIVLLGLAFLLRTNINSMQSGQFAKYEVKDPAEAKVIAKNALAMLAKNYGKGESTLSKNIKNIDKINIFNSLIKK